jgi:hypothetical protein
VVIPALGRLYIRRRAGQEDRAISVQLTEQLFLGHFLEPGQTSNSNRSARAPRLPKRGIRLVKLAAPWLVKAKWGHPPEAAEERDSD